MHNFTNTGTDGAQPEAALLEGSDGYLYGTTQEGGSYNGGTVFKISPSGALTTLHSFTMTGNEGFQPEAALVEGSDGDFYGTTYNGGRNVAGTVYKISRAGALTTLHEFTRDDGDDPRAPVIQARDGNFYGTTYGGGRNDDGTVFKMTPKGELAVIHHFTGGSDGANPAAALVQGSDGNLYGTTIYGGVYNRGTIYKITPAGALTTLQNFSLDRGYQSFSMLVEGDRGDFYGTTYYGGGNFGGVVFKITSAGDYAILHSFTNSSEGAYPTAGLIRGSDGNFYGTTSLGGSGNTGTIFRIAPEGTLDTVHSFMETGADGANPDATLTEGKVGTFYGTTKSGGGGNGTVFKFGFPPVISSPSAVTAATGKTLSFQIKATYNPTSYGVGGLFKGITVNQQTGLISGTPTAVGKHALTLRATNAFGTGTAALTLTVVDKPTITSPDAATAQVAQAFSYQIKATNTPTNYGVGGLRPGLSVDAKTGNITGTPTGSGIFTLTLKASNAAGLDTQSLTLTIKPRTPVITSPDTDTATVGMKFSYQIKATGNPTSYGVGGLFNGFTVDQETGLISGTPTSAGTHSLDLLARNAGGTGHETLTLAVTKN